MTVLPGRSVRPDVLTATTRVATLHDCSPELLDSVLTALEQGLLRYGARDLHVTSEGHDLVVWATIATDIAAD